MLSQGTGSCARSTTIGARRRMIGSPGGRGMNREGRQIGSRNAESMPQGGSQEGLKQPHRRAESKAVRKHLKKATTLCSRRFDSLLRTRGHAQQLTSAGLEPAHQDQSPAAGT